MNNDILNTPIEFLKGVGPNRAKLIKDELKISNFKDLLFQFPYRYIDKTKYHKISEIDTISSEIQLIGEIKELKEVGIGSKKRLVGSFSQKIVEQNAIDHSQTVENETLRVLCHALFHLLIIDMKQ